MEASQRDWVPEPGEDLLINVLGPEHPGRTRAVGCNNGLRQGIQGINEKKRKLRNKECLDEMVSKAVKQMKAEFEEEKRKLRSDMEVQMQMIMQKMMPRNEGLSAGSLGVTKSSCDSTQAFDELDEIQIEMGSTNVRIGSTIYGPKEYSKKQQPQAVQKCHLELVEATESMHMGWNI